MRVIAVDPGETIGMAYFDSETDDFEVEQVNDTSEAIVTYHDWGYEHGIDFEIIENYVGSGHLSKEGKQTIMVLGLFHLGYGLQLVPSQARLAYVDYATMLIGDDARHMHRNGRDAIAALAHAIAYAKGNA